MTPQEIVDLRTQRYNGTVVFLHKVHSDLMILRVKPDFPKPEHLPGQYSTLGLGNWEPRLPGTGQENLKPEDEKKLTRRAYSLGCTILDNKANLLDLSHTDYLEFYVVLVRTTDDGKPAILTPRLFMLTPGDRIQIGEKITGHYTLEGIKPTDNIIFLSTGTGESPHNYMLWDLLRKNHEGKIVASCCVRYNKDLAFIRVHQELMRRFPNYRYIPLTTRDGTENQKRYIQDLLTSGEVEAQLGEPLNPVKTHVFLCGNPKMIGVPIKNMQTGERSYPTPMGVIEILEQRGFEIDNNKTKTKGNIHFEEYW